MGVKLPYRSTKAFVREERSWSREALAALALEEKIQKRKAAENSPFSVSLAEGQGGLLSRNM